jgi:hypothetical protein
MKIKIGPYLTWWGPYQIAEAICFWAKPEKDEYGIESPADWVHDFGEMLSNTWVLPICQWIYDKRQRKIQIAIDNYDTWGMDSTLALIIVPMLKQLRDTTHGYPSDFMTDRSDWDGDQIAFKDHGFEYPEETGFEEWQATLDKMIWSFEQLNIEWRDQYQEGEIDFDFVPCEDKPDFSEMVHGPKHTFVADYDAIRKHEEKIQEGIDLFGKYFRGLWD